MPAGRASAQGSEFSGELTASHSLPVIKIVILNASGVQRQAIALIDTGSASCLVEQSIPKELGLVQAGSEEALTHDGKRTDPLYSCQFRFPDGHSFDLQAAARPMQTAALSFDAIIGMSLLRYYDVRIKALERLVTLRWLGA
ncbi:hypothetical protein SAMN05444158_7504 [Bradyrhizobium canariense]|uniref:Aspartyl protease n=2 Tax=Bradyrhizobium canariense TaxID=255045 RepID=A0A1H2BU72_9BRAD|nr:hypothetical protein SAMN05444158_7504 [Bradyrhizobium canariense]